MSPTDAYADRSTNTASWPLPSAGESTMMMRRPSKRAAHICCWAPCYGAVAAKRVCRLVRGAGARSYRSISPACRALSSQPAHHRCCCRWTRQTDRHSANNLLQTSQTFTSGRPYHPWKCKLDWLNTNKTGIHYAYLVKVNLICAG